MFLVDTYISQSLGKGLGIFATFPIKKGTIVWEFIEGMDIRIHKNDLPKLNTVQLKFINTYFWIEGDYYYSSCDHSMFQNHSKNPNVIVAKDKIYINNSELPMIAVRDINQDEELLVDYEEFDDSYSTYKHTLVN